MSSLFDIGLSGLNASKAAMYIVSNNIANANNPFYSRREIDFVEQEPGLYGNGVKTGDVRRIVDKVANDQLLRATQDSAKYSTIYSNLSNLESFVDNKDTSVVKFINASLSTLQTLNATPSSMQSRNQYLYELNSMSARFKGVSQQYGIETAQTQATISEDVNQINNILKNLVEVNKKIGANGGQLNDNGMMLLDQRDKLLNDLSGLVNYEKIINQNGSVDIQLSNGQPLIINNQASQLVVINSATNNGNIDIAIQTNNGPAIVTDLFTSGEISGLIDYYTNSVSQSQRDLDRLALAIGQAMNKQNQLGVDLNGNLGGNIFNDPNSPGAMADRVFANDNNVGSSVSTVYINDASQLSDSDYTLSFSSGNNYQLVRISDGQVMQSGVVTSFPAEISADGFTMTINSGTFAAGDSYTVSPTHNAANLLNVSMTDSSKLALGFPVSSSASQTNSGSGIINVTQVTDTNNSAFSVANQLNPPINVVFINATTYNLVNANDGSIVEGNISYDPVNGSDIFPTPGGYDPGYRVHLSGDINAGDNFSINYNNDSQGDNRNGIMLANLYNTGIVDNGSFTFAQAFNSMVSNISALTNTAQINKESSDILQTQAQLHRDSYSAVSLEEETMNLARYQESYMANAQVLEVMKQTMDTIFAVLRA